MRRTLTLATAALLAVALAVPAIASPPEDADEPHEAGYSAVDTRAHFVAHLLDEFLATIGDTVPPATTTGCFDDLDGISTDLARGVCFLAAEDIVQGTGDNPATVPTENDFEGSEPIRRDQAASFTARAYVLARADVPDSLVKSDGRVGNELASDFYYDVKDEVDGKTNPHTGAIHFLGDLDDDDVLDTNTDDVILQGRTAPIAGDGRTPFVPHPNATDPLGNPTADYDPDAGLLWVGHTHLIVQRWAAAVAGS